MLQYLIPVISAAYCGLITYFTIKFTDKQIELKLKTNDCEDGETEHPSSYTVNKYKNAPVLIAFASVIGGGFAYYIYDKTPSMVSIIQLIAFLGLLMSAALIDKIIRRIPNKISLSIIIIGIVAAIVKLIIALKQNTGIEFAKEWLIYNFLCAVGILAVLLAVSKATKHGMGYGDIKLITSMCFAAGFTATFSSIFISILLCTVYAGIGLLIKKKSSSDSYPLAPFFLAGYIVSAVFGIV